MASSSSVHPPFFGIPYQIHFRYHYRKVHLKNIFREMIHFNYIGLGNFLVEVFLIIAFAKILCTMS